MSIDQIAAEALRLTEKERASLASRLLRPLPPVAFGDDEGVAEALRRDAVLRASPPQRSGVRACKNYRIIGVCPVPAQGSADITALYVAQYGVVPVGKRLFVGASTMVDRFESLPRQFQARVPAAA